MAPQTRGKRRRAAAPAPADEAHEAAGIIAMHEKAGADAKVAPSERTWHEAHSALTNELLPLTARPEELLSTLLSSPADDEAGALDGEGRSDARRQLVSASQSLFRYIERLAGMEAQLKDLQQQRKLKEVQRAHGDDDEDTDANDADEEEEEEPCGLSGLPSLYTGHAEGADEDADEAAVEVDEVDAETVWGQVDLQNAALLPRLKKTIRKLGKRAKGEGRHGEEEVVRILDAGAVDSDADGDSGSDGSGEGGEEMDEGSAASGLDEEALDDEGESDENSAARRVRERMERAMADMSDNESAQGETGALLTDAERRERLKELTQSAASLEQDDGDDDDEEADEKDAGAEEEFGIDPTREEMRDGFFDLHEMEAFADEEEEMLPDEAYGDEMPEEKDKKPEKKKLPHLRDRMGEEESEEGSDDDEEEDELAKRYEATTIRRKKYRADDEVEALYQLYDDAENEFDDSDEEGGGVDPSSVTAADFFGKPDKKLILSYKASHGTKSEKKKGGTKKQSKKIELVDPDDDADSWDNHNFEEEGVDWKEKGEGSESEEEENDREGEDDGGDEDDGEEEDEDVNNLTVSEKLSAHGLQSKKLEQQTLQIEQDMMAEKPWRMMGEAKGANRATDSLLDSTPEFEVAFKPPPILTAEHTTNIEEMIKKRILDEDWDDVVPRELPDILGGKKRGEAPEVSQEKSKLGLGELYEREYLKKTEGFDRDAHEKRTEEDAAKEEMKRLFANLCSQLDALSNYHFAPRPVAEEADVQQRDVPAIAMEEVLPLHVSQSRGAAPEEVYAGGKGRKSVLKGESELDQAERKRIRAAKKAARRKNRKQKHADERLISKLQPGLGLNNPYEKRKLREELQMARASGKVVVASENKGEWGDEAAAGKEYQTSTKFFQKMQENVERDVHGDGGDDGRGKKKRRGLEAGQGGSAYRL